MEEPEPNHELAKSRNKIAQGYFFIISCNINASVSSFGQHDKDDLSIGFLFRVMWGRTAVDLFMRSGGIGDKITETGRCMSQGGTWMLGGYMLRQALVCSRSLLMSLFDRSD
jgi:hypothetical protein